MVQVRKAAKYPARSLGMRSKRRFISSRRHDPDYLVSNFVTTTYNRDGRVETVLAAAEMQHYPDDDSTDLMSPRVEQARPAQPALCDRVRRAEFSES